MNHRLRLFLPVVFSGAVFCACSLIFPFDTPVPSDGRSDVDLDAARRDGAQVPPDGRSDVVVDAARRDGTQETAPGQEVGPKPDAPADQTPLADKTLPGDGTSPCATAASWYTTGSTTNNCYMACDHSATVKLEIACDFVSATKITMCTCIVGVSIYDGCSASGNQSCDKMLQLGCCLAWSPSG